MKTPITRNEDRFATRNQRGFKVQRRAMSVPSAKMSDVIIKLLVGALVLFGVLALIQIGFMKPSASASAVPAAQVLPFGPEIAAMYGKHDATVLPFGPGLAATYGVPAR